MVRKEESSQLRRYTRYPIGVNFKVREDDQASSGEVLFDTINVSAGGASNFRNDRTFDDSFSPASKPNFATKAPLESD